MDNPNLQKNSPLNHPETEEEMQNDETLELEDLLERAATGEYSMTPAIITDMIKAVKPTHSGSELSHERRQSGDTDALTQEVKQEASRHFSARGRQEKIESIQETSSLNDISVSLHHKENDVPCSYTSQRETADLREQLEDMRNKFETVDMLLNNYARSKTTLDQQIQTLMKNYADLTKSFNTQNTILMGKINYLLEHGLKIETITGTSNQIDAKSLTDVTEHVADKLSSAISDTRGIDKQDTKTVLSSGKRIISKHKLRPID